MPHPTCHLGLVVSTSELEGAWCPASIARTAVDVRLKKYILVISEL